LHIDYCQFSEWGYKKPPEFGHVKYSLTPLLFFVIPENVQTYNGGGMANANITIYWDDPVRKFPPQRKGAFRQP